MLAVNGNWKQGLAASFEVACAVSFPAAKVAVVVTVVLKSVWIHAYFSDASSTRLFWKTSLGNADTELVTSLL